MMGLGSGRLIQQLIHPARFSAENRDDSAISDATILGAIIAFGAGTLIWFLGDAAPPLIFTYYPYRDQYLAFFFLLLTQMLIFQLLFWAFGSSTSAVCGGVLAVALVFGLVELGLVGATVKVPTQCIAFALLVAYSFAIGYFAVRKSAVSNSSSQDGS